MHLARRGWRRSEKKIHVDDVDGLVRNLSASITAAELTYKEKEKGEPEWEPKAGGAAPRVCQSDEGAVRVNTWTAPEVNEKNDVAANETPSKTWRTTVLPADFRAFDFTLLEEDTRELTHFPDDWVQNPIDFAHQAVLTTAINPDQKGQDDWRANYSPDVHSTIIPFVWNYMLTSVTDGSTDRTTPQMRERNVGHGYAA